MFFRWGKTHAAQRARFAGLCVFRESADGKDSVLVLVNTDVEKGNSLALVPSELKFPISDFKFELLGLPAPKLSTEKDKVVFTLAPGACHCLVSTSQPVGLSGEAYRRARAQAAWALQALNQLVPVEIIDGLDWRWLAEQAGRSPANFLAAASQCSCDVKSSLPSCCKTASNKRFSRAWWFGLCPTTGA